VNDAELKSLLHEALVARDRRRPPPDFAGSWRAAAATSDARRAAAFRLDWVEPAAAVAGIAAIALAALWSFMGPGAGPAPWTEAADLQLAREFAPARQWPVATDALLHAYDYAPPSDIDIPEIENPFEESFL
jgi:hypothetical protein